MAKKNKEATRPKIQNHEFKCFRGRGGNWVAVCDSLALTIQSKTLTTLMEDIAQTIKAIRQDRKRSS